MEFGRQDARHRRDRFCRRGGRPRPIARGERVVLLARKNSPRGNVEGLDAEIAIGDLRDAASLAPVLRGVDKLYHVAADYRFWARDPQEIIEANRVGVGNIMTEALRAGVSRIVYTSSVATLKLNVEGRPVDETSPATPEQAIGAYKKSKTIAERLVEKMVAEQGLPAVIVNPSTPIGPRDIKPTPTGRVIVEAGNGRMPAYVDTGLNLVHVDDVAAGHLAAMERGRIGERYILGGQDAPLAAMLAEIAMLVGRKPPSLIVPRTPLFPLAHAAEFFARFTGKNPSSPPTLCAWPNTACIFPHSRPSANWVFPRAPMPRPWPTRWRGSAKRA